MDARDALRDAERVINGFDVASEPIDIQVASSNLALAEHALEQAKKDFKPYEKKPESNLKRAALLSKLSDAQKRYDNSLKQYNRLTGVIVPEFDYQQAQYDLEIAQARLQLAEEQYEMLQDGPDPAELNLALRRLTTAQDKAAAAQASLADLELKAPFSGTVSQVNFQGQEWVTPGQTVLELIDLDHLRVETTDLGERDIPKIQIGQPVSVFIDALNQDMPGSVILIAPTADTLGGDVVYKATIDLDAPLPDLRAGMSAEVSFDTGE
jgi:multidrug resistance efflux pump